MSLSPIQINNNALPVQPTRLREYKIYQQTDAEAIDGTMQRNRISTANNPQGYKNVTEMTFDKITSADYSYLNNLFVSGSGVYYYNPASKGGTALAFSGLPFPEEGEYVPGESLLSDYTVRIREI